MKKLYICPMIEIVKVVTSKMMAASIGINKTGAEVDAGNAAAREGGGFWDDYEEE